MSTGAIILLIALSVVILVLLVVLLGLALASSRRGNGDVLQSISMEFSQNRGESQAATDKLKFSLDSGLASVNERLAAQTKENYEQRERLNTTVNEALSAINQRTNQALHEQNAVIASALEAIRQSNERKLDEMRLTVDEKLSSTLTQRLDSSFNTVSERLELLYRSLGEMKELSVGVTDNITSLNRVLTNVKTRGTWAEVQLESILEQTIPNMYEKNFSPNNSAERVEFAVKMPTGDNGALCYLPIDSKFPMEDYVRLCSASEAGDSQAVAVSRKALEDRIVSEARSVAKYINVPLTTPFAVLYLATEGLYAEVLSSRNGIAELLQSKYSIMLAGPSTITALLNSLAMGFRTIAVNEKANEIRELLAAVKSQYEVFEEVLDKAKRNIDSAGKTLDTARHRNSIIQKKLRSVESLDSLAADRLLSAEDNFGI